MRLSLTMLLTPGHVLWPVTGVCLLVVEQPPDTELFGGCPVPAGPVAGAGGLVPEYSVQPVTVLCTLGWVWDSRILVSTANIKKYIKIK